MTLKQYEMELYTSMLVKSLRYEWTIEKKRPSNKYKFQRNI